MHDAKANEMDKKASAKLMLQKSAGGKRTYRKSTIHQSEAKDKGLSRFKRNIRESGTSIKTKNTNLHIAGRTGVLAAGAVTEQVEGGHEVSQAAYLAYEASRPVTGTASKGAALFRKKAAAEAKKRIKKVEAGKKLAKKTAKKAAKDTAKAVAKETAKETAKTTAKVATKTATKAAATAAGTAVAPGVGTAIGMAAGYAAGVSIEVKDEKMTNRSRKIKFFLDKMKAQENQTDSVAKLVKDLIVRKAITWVKAAAPIIGLVLLLLVLVVAMIAVPVATLEKKVKSLSSKKMMLYSDYKDDKLTREEYVKRSKAMVEQIDELHQEIEQLKTEIPPEDNSSSKFETQLESIINMESFDREKIQKVIKKVIINGEDNIEIIWNTDDPFFK